MVAGMSRARVFGGIAKIGDVSGRMAVSPATRPGGEPYFRKPFSFAAVV